MAKLQGSGKAVVIGAGIAGLLAARVLSDFYKEVVIVERDTLPAEPVNRVGVPQSYHPHRVLPRGDMILGRYFPGYIADMLEMGADPSDEESVILANRYGSFPIQPPKNTASSSRPLLEWVIRQRVQRVANIHFLCNTEVTGLITTDNGDTVTGIYTKERNEQKTEGSVTADMVVDTAGRSSKTANWLEALGYQIPEPEVLKVSLGYSTRYYKIPESLHKEWRSILSDADPDNGICSSYLFRIENNIAGSLLFSAGDEPYPPTDSEAHQEGLRHLAAAGVADITSRLEPIQAPRGYRVKESVRHHFERMDNWPAGLLVVGDAFCSFDPIYGQGMTVAAIEAETIGKCLEEQRSNPQPQFERRVLERMQRAVEPAWWLSSISDLRWKGVEHSGTDTLKGVAFVHKYIDLYTKKATKLAVENNFSMYGAMFMMNSLVLPPREFFNAKVLAVLLNDDGSDEELKLRAELGESDPQKFQARIDELIPSFEGAYDLLNLAAVTNAGGGFGS
ncbi:NAD(P)/FAD-dependent oxidoreductase [Paenibacillus sp. NPDC058174]|uniref:NAD(P)/FAD-dependent oxidoreductase n=1 Tax=Paenibacillus sp. NPDC058174 TaxID=3346366 RepID=UPI0036D93B39